MLASILSRCWVGSEWFPAWFANSFRAQKILVESLTEQHCIAEVLDLCIGPESSSNNVVLFGLFLDSIGQLLELLFPDHAHVRE